MQGHQLIQFQRSCHFYLMIQHYEDFHNDQLPENNIKILTKSYNTNVKFWLNILNDLYSMVSKYKCRYSSPEL